MFSLFISFSFFLFIRYFLYLLFNLLYPSPSPCSPTHPLLLSCPGIPLHWGMEPSQDQGPFLPVMSNKAILCYICSWSHGSLHVYSLVGVFYFIFFPLGDLGVLVGSYCCSSYGAAIPFSSVGLFSTSSIGYPVLSPMVG